MRRILLLLIVWMTALVFVAAGQNKTRSGAVPRSGDGKPDLTGVWQGGSAAGTDARRNPRPVSDSVRPNAEADHHPL
jgi:hypothetical protein